MARYEQETLLKTLIGGPEAPCAIAVHGPTGTGKSHTLRSIVQSLPSWSWVQCDQCATTRVMLQRALRQILVKTKTGVASDAQCENFNVFCDVLADRNAFKEVGRHVLVLDRIDRLPERYSELLTGIGRIPELTTPAVAENLVIVLVYSTPEPRSLLAAMIPHVWFPRYSAEVATAILGTIPKLCPIPENWPEPMGQQILEQFLRITVETLGAYTGTDISLLTRATRRIWPQFIDGVSAEDVSKGFPPIYTAKSHLFMSESSFLDTLMVDQTAEVGSGLDEESMFLLVAAYFASYNPPRYDVTSFSQAKGMRAKRRGSKPRKASELPPRSLAPPAFELERLLAIYRALYEAHSGTAYRVSDVAAVSQISELVQRHLILRSTGSGSTRDDPLDSRTKWKVNVSEGFARYLAGQLDISLDDYLVQ